MNKTCWVLLKEEKKFISDILLWIPTCGHTFSGWPVSIVQTLDAENFSRYVLWPSSGISCQTHEPTWNFEPHPLFNPRGLLALIPLTITQLQMLSIPLPITVKPCVLLDTWRNGYRCWFPMLLSDNHLEVAGE